MRAQKGGCRSLDRKLCIFALLLGLFVVSLFVGGDTKSASVEKDGFSASSDENDLIVYYFYGEGCPHCAKVKPFLDEMEQKYPLHLHKYDIYTNRGYLSLFDEYSSRYDIPLGERGVPALFVSDTFFVGDSPILDGFEQVVKRALEERSPTGRVLDVETPENLAQETATMAGEVTIFAITVAALVDAVSPCSIAILVFLIGARVLVAGQRKRALKVGLAFCLSVFIGYFLFGLGLFTIVQTSGFSGTFSLLVGLIAILAGIFYLKDVFWYGRGGFAMEVPRSLKPLLMKMLKGVTSPFGAFAMGFVVVCFELPCTGGPYLFILGQLADNATRLQAIPLLLYYNVIFVLPLVIISLLLYSNLFSVGRVREWNEKNKRLLRLVGGFAMVALGFLVIPASQTLQLFWMFLGFFKAFGPHLLVIISLYLAVSFGMQKNLRSKLMRLPGCGVLLLSLIFMPVFIVPTSINESYTTPPPPPPSPPTPDRADTILMGSEGIREEIDIPSFLRRQSSDISGLEGLKGTDGTSLLDLLIQDDLRERENAVVGGLGDDDSPANGEITNAGVGGQVSIQSISSCTVISSPGVYTLTADIIDSSATRCIEITSSNVIFDGNNKMIDGIDVSNTYGVYAGVSPSTRLTNVTVKNLRVKGWRYGIFYHYVDYSSIENNIASYNSRGIYLDMSHNNTIRDNVANGYDDSRSYAGIYLYYSDYNTVGGNTANSNYVFGIYLINSWYNNVTGNTARNQGQGIELDGSSQLNVLEDNQIGSLNRYGINLESGAHNNSIIGNNIFDNMYGIRLSSDNNIVRDNIITHNGFYNPPWWEVGSGLWLGSYSDGNTIYNNLFDNYSYYYYDYVNVEFAAFNSHTWNTTKQEGKNILGRSYLGGNYWSDYDEPSEGCTDSDPKDGICDSSYTVGWYNIDYLPLAPCIYDTIDITSSTKIECPGYYRLTNNILDSSATRGIEIAVGDVYVLGRSDVTLDGQGYQLGGRDGSFTYGVYVIDSPDVTVKNLTVTDWNYGIYYENSQNGRIENNTVDLYDGFGIRIRWSDSTIVANNTVNLYDGFGIRIGWSDSTIVANNTVNLSDYGISLQSSGSNTIERNTVSNNDNGIHLASSNLNTIIDNTPSNNDNGIYLASSNLNTIIGNIPSNNIEGIYLRYSSNNNITGNIVSNNDKGIGLNSSNSNTIYNNIFNNTLNAYDDGVNFWNRSAPLSWENIVGGPYIGGNFWSDYTGLDDGSGTGVHAIAGDDIGDTELPYDSGGNIAIGGDFLPLLKPLIPCGTVISEDTDLIDDVLNCMGIGLIIGADDITFDGKGYTISGVAGSTFGIYLNNKTNVNIKNSNIRNYYIGIFADNAENANISNNNLESNFIGLRLLNSHQNEILKNNIRSNTLYGVQLLSSSNNKINDNTLEDNNLGLYFFDSESYYNEIKGNLVNGDLYYHFVSDMVGGIFENKVLNAFDVSNLGKVSLINCSNFILKNLTLENNELGAGLFLYISDNNSLNITASNNVYGIRLESSYNNDIEVNAAQNYYGIFLNLSSGNEIINSNTSNNHYGIYLAASSGNNLTNIHAEDNYNGILLSYSNQNNLTIIKAYSNVNGIFLEDNSSENSLSSLDIRSNNKAGLRFDNSSKNRISDSYILDSGLYDFTSTENSLNHAFNMRINTTQISFEGLDISIRYIQIAPEDPQGFSFGIGKYLEIDKNSENSWILLNMTYEDLGSVRETSLNLLKFDSLSGLWRFVPGSTAYTSEKYVSANITSFSIFGILGVIRPTRVVYEGYPCVTGDAFYTSIEQAATDSNSGDRIIVCPGDYTELPIIVDKTVDITSYTEASETIVNAASGDLFQISASGVNVTGLTLKNAGDPEAAAIRLSGSNSIISSNIIDSNYYGIVITGSNNVLINNAFERNTAGIEMNSGSYDNNITENTFSYNEKGVWARSATSTNNFITSNVFSNNAQGINLTGASSYNIENNVIFSNTDGIYLQFSSSNEIASNIIYNQSTAIYAYQSDYNNLENNIITNNENGVHIRNSRNNTLSYNNLEDNINGTRIYYSIYISVVNNYVSNNSLNGIYLLGSDFSNVSSNFVILSERGIHLIGSHNNIISENIAYGNVKSSIRLTRSENNVLTKNVVYLTKHGIYLDDSSYNKIEENHASKNFQSGITVTYGSTDNVISSNTIKQNVLVGIYVYTASNSNNITDNTIEAQGEFGITLTTLSSYNTLSENFVGNNTLAGIFLVDSADANVIRNNTIQDHVNQGLILNGSVNNLVYQNNFLFNSNPEDCQLIKICQAFDNTNYNNAWDNGPVDGGNYWSDYDEPSEGCNDVNADGFCDDPYTKITNGTDNYPVTSCIGEYSLEVEVGILDDENRFIIVQLVDTKGNPVMVSGREVAFYDVSSRSSPLILGEFSQVLTTTDELGKAYTVYILPKELDLATISVESEEVREEIDIPSFIEFPRILQVEQKFRKYFVQGYELTNEMNILTDWGIMIRPRKIIFDRPGGPYIEIPFEEIVPLTSITLDGALYPRGSNNTLTFDMGSLPIGADPITITAVGDLTNSSISDVYFIVLEKHNALEGLGGLRQLKPSEVPPGWAEGQDYVVYTSNLELTTNIVDQYIKQKISDALEEAIGIELPIDKIDDTIKKIRNIFKQVRDVQQKDYSQIAIDIADALMDLGIISFEQRADLIAWLIDESFSALKFLDWILTNDVIQYTETFLEYVPSFDLPDFIPYVGGSYGVDLNSLVLFDYAEYNTLDGTASTTTGGKVTIRLGETVGNANLMISGTNAYGPAASKLELIQKRYDFQIGGRVPVYEWNFGVAKVGIAIEYQAKLYIVYVPVGETIRFDLGGVDIEVTALGYGKIDIVIASASFELGVGVGIGAEVSRARGFEITSLRGLVLIRLDWKLLFYKDHWGRKWVCDIWPAIQGGDVNCWEEEASEPEGWMVMNRDYVNDDYAEFVANQGISHSSPTTETMLIRNIFPEADPQLALNKDNDNLMTVYVHDDISKNITQSFEIYYTRWDGFNWTVPAPITNDSKPDVKPDVVFDSYGNAVAVWVSVNNETLTNETRLDETIRYAEIAYSIFDSSLNEWTEPELLTDNDFFDYDPTLAAGKDGKVMAIWYADEDNTIFIGHNATDEHDMNKTVYFSIWNGSAWSSPAPAITDIPLSNKMEFDYTGDEAIIVWSQDMDGNSSTLEDREIMYSTWDGNSWSAPVRLTNNSFEDRLPTVIYDDEEILLAWESIEYPAENVTRYKIRYSTFNGTWSEATEITDTGQVEQLILTKNPQENTVLIWQTTSDQGTDMFYSVLDKSHNRWGAENQLTNDDSADVKYSSVINSNNDIISSYIKTEVLLRNETVTVSNETFSVTVTEQGNSSLFLLTHHIFTDIEINNEDITLSNANPAPGEIITINATVHNVGDLSVDDIRVRFSDGYPGTQIGTTQIIDSIPAGENKTVSVQWKIPAISQSHDIYVELDPLNDIAEENETNNIANIRTVLPDIAIGFAQANNLDGEVIINSSITNIGHVSASNIPVSFYFSDSFDNKTLIGTETISYLEPGAEENVSIVWNTASLPAGHYFVFVVIDPNDVIIEGDETNNVDMIIVKSFTDLAIKDIVVTDVIEGDVTFNATISNLGSFDSYNVTLQVFKDIPFYVEESTGLFSAPRIMLNESLLILNETIPFIGARENITVSGNWYATPGYYDIYAIVDPYDLIKETDDSNNVDSIGLRILQKLNLTSLDATDIDNDGLFDYVSAKVEADIPSDGYYYLRGNLTDNTGTQITTASNLTYLTSGPQNITINFNGILIRQHAANGTYILKDVKLYDSTSLLGLLLGTHPTPDFTYTQFQTPPATLVAVVSDQGIDLDQDGLYDFLEVEANINVTKAGTYNVRALLYDVNGNYTAKARNSTYLNTGIQAVKLRFSGRAIFSHGVDGPYNLSYITLYNENWNEIDRRVDAYVTAAYAYTWFEGVEFDMAIRDVTPSQTIVGQGSTISIDVTVTNKGAYTETFNVTVYYASDPIETQTVTNLPSGTSTNLTFLWNTTGVPYGNYTISAYATPLLGETFTADNTYMNGIVLITIPGDVNGDRTVEVSDLDALAEAYGSTSASPNWNPNADINNDERVDVFDIRITGTHWGQSWRPLTVIGPWSGVEMDAFMRVLRAFEEKTGIDVEYKFYTTGDLAALLPSMFDAGKTPGDVIFMWSWFIKEKSQEGHILNVTDLINEADFMPGALDPVKVGDTLYGGAYTGKVKPGFWYRKSFFAAHNLTEPTTWDEFTTLLDDIAAVPGIVNPIASGDDLGWPLSDVTEHFLITFGGPELHKNLTVGSVAWNNTEVRTIFADRLVPLLQGNFSDPIEWTTALDLWWNGDYGLYFMGSWITGMVDDPEDLGVFSLPEAQGLVFAADFFFIPAYTEYSAEAKELFKFLASEEAQSIQVAQGGHISTNVHVPLYAYPPVDRQVAELMTGKEILTDLDDTIGGEFQTTFWEQLKLLWLDPTKLDEVLDAIQAVAPIYVTSGWSSFPVTFDGQITTAQEWSDTVPIDLNLPVWHVGPETVPARVWMKNDDTWLYMLYRVEWPSADIDPSDGAYIDYFWGAGESDLGFVGFDNSTGDLYGWDGTSWDVDTEASPPGENNVEGAATHDGAYYWFEFRKELDSADGYDWSFTPSQIIETGNLFVAMWDGSTGTYYEEYITLQLSTECAHVVFEEAHLSLFTIGSNPAYEVTGGYADFADYLTANGYFVSTINPGTTIDPSVLAPVDVLVIVAPNQGYSTSEIDTIETWVKGGGTLLLITDWDDYGLQASSIAGRFGFTLRFDWILDSDENLGGYWGWPYYDGANLLTHQVTAGVARVEMYASDGITGAPADEIPLIVTDSDGTAVWYSDSSPALGVSLMSAIDGGTAGSGRLIVITDSNLWDSAYDFDGDGDINFYDSDHEILALNVINWLSAVAP